MSLYTPQLIERARGLRHNMTKQELNLVIEIDGEQHKNSVEYDNERTEFMNSLGLKVIRFNNKEIDYDFDNVCKKINIIALS